MSGARRMRTPTEPTGRHQLCAISGEILHASATTSRQIRVTRAEHRGRRDDWLASQQSPAVGADVAQVPFSDAELPHRVAEGPALEPELLGGRAKCPPGARLAGLAPGVRALSHQSASRHALARRAFDDVARCVCRLDAGPAVAHFRVAVGAAIYTPGGSARHSKPSKSQKNVGIPISLLTRIPPMR
jgi:hypothetical protein